ncbi:MAG: glycerol kinase [Omnitrophica WOR_2 bacterium RIFOXYB2_FULL_38_16]|nr:MAG: glycerol kinase [Omnitrophica WOR_2 bacterium GWA2_37_7]OGX58377.1 MAG: glycerol kinase [Omnitrophica WOR_2 bacterium RIFOXYB2_FULL_38_16]
MKYILSIDQGTTGSRAILYDKKGMIKASSYKEFRQIFPKPGWVEHDPIEIWQSVKSSIQNVLKKVSSSDIEAIGITNQRETTVVWDKDTGKPIYNAICWQCRRTSLRCDKLKNKKGEVKLFRDLTGLPIDAYFSATKIEWILKNVKGALAKARSGKLLFGTTDSWVLWNLTKGKVHATDYTNASRTMIFNIDKLKWDDVLLKRFNIPKQMLPSVKQSSGVFGYTEKTGKLKKGIPICGIAGDQQAALFGQACFLPGTMKNTYGTGAFVLLNTGEKRAHSKFGLITTLGCGPKGEPVYVLEGAIFIAGAAIQWLRDGIKIISNPSETMKMAKSLNSNEGVYLVPAFVGLGAPYWDQNSRGIILGLTRGTKRENIVRAALEAMCYQTKDVIEAMQKDSGLRIKSLKVDGGAVANEFLCQFQADIAGIDIVRPKTIETTSLGAAYLAGLAVGYWKNTQEIGKCWMQDKKFSPKMQKKDIQKYYSEWKNAISKTLSCNK